MKTTIGGAKAYSIFQDCVLVILFLKYTHALHTLHTLETPVREALLKPRNFNPHPYPQYRTSAAINIDINTIESLSDEYGDNSIYNIDDGSIGTELSQRQVPANGIYSQGPVQFPPSAPASINRNNNNLNYNFQQLPNPYATLKLKGEINRPNRINKIDHDSLASLPKKQYLFSYAVRDSKSGDDFSHTQQQKNGAVKGTYKVQLPDGRTQVVRYTADHDGYRADVTYLEEKNAKIPVRPQSNSYVAANTERNDYLNYLNSVNVEQSTISSQPIYHLNSYSSSSSNIVNPNHVLASPQLSNRHINIASSLSQPNPTFPTATSSVFVSTSTPKYNDITIQLPTLRKSHVNSGAYVLTPKLTQIGNTYDCYSYYGCSSNGIITTKTQPIDETPITDNRNDVNSINLLSNNHHIYFKSELPLY